VGESLTCIFNEALVQSFHDAQNLVYAFRIPLQHIVPAQNFAPAIMKRSFTTPDENGIKFG
jgi:hypothetical protein